MLDPLPSPTKEFKHDITGAAAVLFTWRSALSKREFVCLC